MLSMTKSRNEKVTINKTENFVYVTKERLMIEMFPRFVLLNWRGASFSTERNTSGKNESCQGVYGCFPLANPWRSPERPVSLAPEPLHKIQPFFCLHSPQRPNCMVSLCLVVSKIRVIRRLSDHLVT